MYVFDAPGSSRQNRRQIKESGFTTKREAEDAEAKRRMEEQREFELAGARGAATEPVPKTLGGLISEFLTEHAEKKLAPKTAERYREQAAYLAPALLAMPITDVKPLNLCREWNRLCECGGHDRKTKAARPFSAKTVRNISGVVSSAFARAVKWGIVDRNPVEDSDPPRIQRSEGIALTPEQQRLVLNAAETSWALPVFLELVAATGARRGEVLALRWCDIWDQRVMIALTKPNQGASGIQGNQEREAAHREPAGNGNTRTPRPPTETGGIARAGWSPISSGSRSRVCDPRRRAVAP